MRRYGREVGLEPSFSIYDVDDQKRAIKFVAQDMGMAWDRSAVNTWARRIDKVTNSAMTVHELQTDARGAEEERFVDLYDAYLQHLKRANACDFGHLISFVVQMLEDNETLQRTFRHRYTRIFIDEFQDTNIAQYRLLKVLAPSDASVTVVGDDDQSIYGWRGASVENLHRFRDEFEDVETIILEQNYRSSQPILDIANDIIAPLPDRLEKKLFTERQDGSNPEVFIGADEREEATFIARMIDEYQRRGVVDLDDIAIFYRTNAQSRNFEEAFRKADIPHELVGSSGFFDRREVKDMLAWLRLAANPSDDVAFQRIVNVPPRGIGSATVDEFNARREFCEDNIEALSELIDNLPARIHGRTQEGLENLKRILIKLREMARDRSADKLIEYVLHETNYLEWLYEKETDTFDERDRNISELLNVANERAGEEVDEELELTPLSYFLATVALQSNQDELETADSGRVRLMTIHTAKGLEFPVVFVTGLEDNLLPLQRRDSPLTDHALAEERRLCYVAFTRAQDRLWLTAAQYRRSRGRAVSTEASRFLLDIDSDSVSMSTESRSPKLIWGGGNRRSTHRAERTVTWDEFDQRPAWERDSTSAAMVPDEGVLFDDSYFPTSSVDDAQSYVGRKARHKLFGVGEIKGADPTGDKVRLTIEFPEVGTKKVILKYVDLI